MFDLDSMSCLWTDDGERCWLANSQILWALIEELGLEIKVKKSKSGHHTEISFERKDDD